MLRVSFRGLRARFVQPRVPGFFIQNSPNQKFQGVFTLASFVLFLSLFTGLTARGGEENIPFQEMDLCAWEADFSFFTQKMEKPAHAPAEAISCKDLLATKDALRITESGATGETSHFEKELLELVEGTPMEPMVPTIATFDREIAGLIVGIGRKESSWGVHTPKSEKGGECFNFWGYRGTGDLGFTPSGYGCFSTPAKAVQTIGNRLEELKELRASTAPARMIVWKCGSSCASHDPQSVSKWISDVNLYYQKIVRE